MSEATRAPRSRGRALRLPPECPRLRPCRCLAGTSDWADPPRRSRSRDRRSEPLRAQASRPATGRVPSTWPSARPGAASMPPVAGGRQRARAAARGRGPTEVRRPPPARRVLRRARGCPYRATTRRVASPWRDPFVHESSCPASRRDRGWGAPAHPRWRSAARSLDRFSIAKVAAKCDPLLVRTAADLGENCGYVHSQALLGAAEKEQASEVPGSPMAALFRGRVGGRITLVECSRRGQPSFTRRALAVTGGSALAEEPGVTLGLLVSVRPADRETAGRESDLGCRSKRGTASLLRSGGRAATLLFDSQGEGEVGCRLTPPYPGPYVTPRPRRARVVHARKPEAAQLASLEFADQRPTAGAAR